MLSNKAHRHVRGAKGLALMARLSRSDAGCVVQALRHFLYQTAECPDRGELANILDRLAQRAAQSERQRRSPYRHKHSKPSHGKTPSSISDGSLVNREMRR